MLFTTTAPPVTGEAQKPRELWPGSTPFSASPAPIQNWHARVFVGRELIVDRSLPTLVGRFRERSGGSSD